MILLTPGPVHIDPKRFAALPPMHHRTGIFREIVIETGGMLGDLCGSSRPAFIFAASGTGAMEAVIANTVPPGGRVLVVEGGKFGRRWAEIAGAFGCGVEVLSFGMGEDVDTDLIAERAESCAPDLIALTHVESSSGLRIDVAKITGSLGKTDALIALDAIASAGSEDIRMDEWGIDVLAGAGQKALAAPAGVSFVIAGKRALEAAGANPRPGFYFAFDRYGDGMATGDTPFTPAVHSIQLLHGSLREIMDAGLESVLERHELCSNAVSTAFEHLGMSVLPESPSRSVQAFIPPEGVSCESVVRSLGERHGIIIAGGQDEMAGKIVRTGFPGIYSGEVLERLIEGISDVLGAAGSEEARKALEPLAGLPALFLSPLT
jgi:aspartate aminotransferase-like enzyme